jgi:hypothetical protein
MNNMSPEKFAELITQECLRVASQSSSDELYKYARSPVNKFSPRTNFKVEFGKMILGVFVLLFACIALFDGLMVPAMWQLTSIIWCVWRFFRLDK